MKHSLHQVSHFVHSAAHASFRVVLLDSWFSGGTAMKHKREVAVTLTPELFDRLRVEAELLGVSITWLVASLIVDTVDKVPISLTSL